MKAGSGAPSDATPIDLEARIPNGADAVIHVRVKRLHGTPVYTALVGLMRDRGFGQSFPRVEKACGFFWPHVVDEAVAVRTAGAWMVALRLGIGADEALECAQKALAATPYMQDASMRIVRSGETFVVALGEVIVVGERAAVMSYVRQEPRLASEGALGDISVRATLNAAGGGAAGGDPVGGDEGPTLIGQLKVEKSGIEIEATLGVESRKAATTLVDKFAMLKLRGLVKEPLAQKLIGNLELDAQGARVHGRLIVTGDAKERGRGLDVLIALAEDFSDSFSSSKSADSKTEPAPLPNAKP